MNEQRCNESHHCLRSTTFTFTFSLPAYFPDSTGSQTGPHRSLVFGECCCKNFTSPVTQTDNVKALKKLPSHDLYNLSILVQCFSILH